MDGTRRLFLKSSGLTALSMALSGLVPGRAEEAPASKKPAAGSGGGKTLLVLGGTSFLGPAVVTAAMDAGWKITLFNRGRTNPSLFPEAEKLHGDRNGNLKALEGRKWDSVVDTSGYVPRHVRDSATLLKDAVKQYVFISTISVYPDVSKPGLDESAPLGKLEDESIEKVTEQTYGPLKVLCEKAAEAAMPGRVTVIRPGLIVGPGDPTDRFTYWPARVARGGEVLAPGSPADPVQFIDVNDLGEWVIRTLRDGTTGVFNAVSPPVGIGKLLETCRSVSGSNATFTWADAEFLGEQKIEAWADMPAWVPPTGKDAGMSQVSAARARGKGLRARPVETTVKDTLDWWKGQPAERRAALKAGLSTEREAAALKLLHERAATTSKS